MGDQYKIESDVPVPTKFLKYPWDQMGIGDSFAVPCAGPAERKRTRCRLLSAGGKWCRKHAPYRRVVVRAMENEVRVWMLRLSQEGSTHE